MWCEACARATGRACETAPFTETSIGAGSLRVQRPGEVRSMRRREFALLLAGGLVWPLAAAGQQRVPRIGVIVLEDLHRSARPTESVRPAIQHSEVCLKGTRHAPRHPSEDRRQVKGAGARLRPGTRGSAAGARGPTGGNGWRSCGTSGQNCFRHEIFDGIRPQQTSPTRASDDAVHPRPPEPPNAFDPCCQAARVCSAPWRSGGDQSCV